MLRAPTGSWLHHDAAYALYIDNQSTIAQKTPEALLERLKHIDIKNKFFDGLILQSTKHPYPRAYKFYGSMQQIQTLLWREGDVFLLVAAPVDKEGHSGGR